MPYLEEYCRGLNTHNWHPQKGQTGILLIDLQEYFRQMSNEILANIKMIIALARKYNIPLLFTQHGHDPKEDPGILGKWWDELIMKGSAEAQLLPEIKVRPGDTIIAKNRYSAFFKTDLEERLTRQKIKDLVIGGVMSNLCCETTARDAFVRDFRVFFLADGTATVNQDLHLATLKNLAYGFATILTCNTFVKSLSDS